jgi:ferritin-like metal-binding protein YciE
MKLKDMNALLVHEVKDLLNAEKQLVKALPKMAAATSNPKLRDAMESHFEETKNHVARLEEVCDLLGIPARGHKCPAMEGLVEEGQEIIDSDGDDAVRDAALIAAAQRVEHYEMAGYGSARTFAQELGLTKVAKLLQATLDEEGKANKKLTDIAESRVNAKAVGAGAS